MTPDPDLLAHLRHTEERVRLLVAHRRADDPNPDDAFRGLYLPDEEIDRLLSRPPSDGDHAIRERGDGGWPGTETRAGRMPADPASTAGS